MKRFRFRLERLERLRGFERRRARGALADATAVARSRRAVREQSEEALRHAASAELPTDASECPATHRQLEAWRRACRERVDAARDEERLADERVAEATHEHAEAAREHRVLERLHEKRFDRWRREGDRTEQKFLDEVHLQSLARRDGSEGLG